MKHQDNNTQILARPGHTTEDITTQKKISPGAKLLCVDASNLQRPYEPGPPVEGNLYCLREVFEGSDGNGYLLVGIKGPFLSNGLECGFKASRFRWVCD